LAGVLNQFYSDLNVNQPSCLLKHPIYEVVEPSKVPNQAYLDQIKYLFDQGLMEEYQRNNPKQIGDFQSYVWMVMGVDNLGSKMKSTTEVFGAIHTKVSEYKQVQEKISKDYEENIREKINQVKRKNLFVLDKLLAVHALLEKVALQHNECKRKPSEELRLYNKIVTLEGVPNEIQTRLLDVRLNRENVKVTRPKGTLSTMTDNESKKNVLELLSKMKKGVEILSKVNQEDADDVDKMLRYAESKVKLNPSQF